MFRSLWSFVKRHRKKFIFSGLVVGGAYCAWHVWLPKLQELLLRRLLQDSKGLEDLLAPDAEEIRRARFKHRQQVADSYARRCLALLRPRHNSCFAIEDCTRRLKHAESAGDRDLKAASFRALQVECIAKAASALYSLHALLLLHRLQFNILGRELAAAELKSPSPTEGQQENSAHTAFLECSNYFQDTGLRRVADVLRRAAATCLDRGKLSPQSKVVKSELSRLLCDICREADSELLTENAGAMTLLPDSVHEEVPLSQREEVRRLTDEVRDYLESPQVLAVFQAVTATGAASLAEQLSASDSEAVPLAKLCGRLIELSNELLDAESGCTPFIERFSDEAKLMQLCEGLYFSSSPDGAR